MRQVLQQRSLNCLSQPVSSMGDHWQRYVYDLLHWQPLGKKVEVSKLYKVPCRQPMEKHIIDWQIYFDSNCSGVLGLVYDEQALVQVNVHRQPFVAQIGYVKCCPVFRRIYVQSGFSFVGNENINASLTKPIMTFQERYHIEGHILVVLLCNSIGSTYVCHSDLV